MFWQLKANTSICEAMAGVLLSGNMVSMVDKGGFMDGRDEHWEADTYCEYLKYILKWHNIYIGE